jgi:hypothetical protein
VPHISKLFNPLHYKHQQLTYLATFGLPLVALFIHPIFSLIFRVVIKHLGFLRLFCTNVPKMIVCKYYYQNISLFKLKGELTRINSQI